MALTPRLELPYPEGSDAPPDVPAWMQPMATILDKAVLSDKGTLAARPAADAVPQGFEYFTTDTNVTYLSDGATWFVKGKRPNGDIAGSELANDSIGWGKTALDGNGLLQQACSVRCAANQTITTQAYADFDGAVFDPSGAFDLENNKFNPQIKGVYQVQASLHGYASDAGTRAHAIIMKNGGTFVRMGSPVSTKFFNPSTYYLCPEVQALVPLNGTTDYLRILVTHSDTQPVEYNANDMESFFYAYLIGRQS